MNDLEKATRRYLRALDARRRWRNTTEHGRLSAIIREEEASLLEVRTILNGSTTLDPARTN